MRASEPGVIQLSYPGGMLKIGENSCEIEPAKIDDQEGGMVCATEATQQTFEPNWINFTQGQTMEVDERGRIRL